MKGGFDEPLRPAHPLPPACTGCPAKAAGARGFVPPTGPTDGPLLFLGQGPGRDEVEGGRPFVGNSGQRLTRWCVASQMLEWKRKARVANVVQCGLPSNRPPTVEEVAFCRTAHWGRELEGRRAIVTLGVPALKAVIDPRGGLDDTGRWVRLSDGTPALGLVHPAAILRGLWGLDPFQIMHLKRVREVLEGREPYVPDWSKPAPKTNLWPTLTELREWESRLGPEGVTVDVEAAGNVLRHVGLRSNDSLEAVQIGFRREDGIVWEFCPLCGGWDPENPRSLACRHPFDEFDAVVWWLARLLADARIPKTMHNGQAYDIPEQLENVGFIVRGFTYDTLLMAHLRLPEMRKGLEPLGGAFLGLSGWKSLSGAEEEGDLK